MSKQTIDHSSPDDPGVQPGFDRYSRAWKDHQAVLQYLRQFGRRHPPTGRLIMLAIVEGEADAEQLVRDTGACLYAINENLAELTRQGILVRRTLTAGRFRSSRYRIDQDVLAAKIDFNWITDQRTQLSAGDSLPVKDAKE